MTGDPRIPIYHVLGVRPNASLSLARELYWRRVARLRDAGLQQGELEEAFAELNRALEIIMDKERRTGYDALHNIARPPTEPAPASPRALAIQSTLAATTAILAGGQMTGPAVVGVAMTAWSAVMAGSYALALRRSGQLDALAVLQLSEGASLDDVEAAYQTLASVLLAHAGETPNIIRQLETLDRAYISATTLLAARSAGVAPPRVRTVRGGRRAMRSRVIQSRLHALAAVTVSTALSRAAESRFASAATRLASTASDQAVDHTLARLSLTVPGGRSAVSVTDRPRVLGRSPGCDLTLVGIDVAPQHAIVWRTDGLLVLHVMEPVATVTVNGRPMRWAILEDGDLIEVGMSQIRVTVPPCP